MKLEEQNQMLQSDNEKFQTILKRYDERKSKLHDNIAMEKAEQVSNSTSLATRPRLQQHLNIFQPSFSRSRRLSLQSLKTLSRHRTFLQRTSFK
jgi:hypothetical protein